MFLWNLHNFHIITTHFCQQYTLFKWICLKKFFSDWGNHQCGTVFTLLRNQIQPERSATDLFSSNYHFSYTYQSFHWFFKIFHWVPYEKRPFLRFFTYFHSALPNMAVFACFWPVFAIRNDHKHHMGWIWINSHFCIFWVFALFADFGHFWAFLHFSGFSGGWGGFGGATEL